MKPVKNVNINFLKKFSIKCLFHAMLCWVDFVKNWDFMVTTSFFEFLNKY